MAGGPASFAADPRNVGTAWASLAREAADEKARRDENDNPISLLRRRRRDLCEPEAEAAAATSTAASSGGSEGGQGQAARADRERWSVVRMAEESRVQEDAVRMQNKRMLSPSQCCF